MLQILLTPNPKRNPARIANPLMLFAKPFRQERIANGTRKWNVDDPAMMHMSNFSISEAKLTSSKTMWMDRDLRPRRKLDGTWYAYSS